MRRSQTTFPGGTDGDKLSALHDDDDAYFQKVGAGGAAGSHDRIDMMTCQQTLLRSILNLTSGENQREQRRRAKQANGNANSNASNMFDDDGQNDFDDDDDDQKICVGADGIYLEKMLFKMKVLVYDQQTQNLIAPIFKVGDLRDCNVVLHTSIKAKREACPGLPAVYLVEPTEENFQAIANDCQRNLYDFVFVNFTRQINDQDLDKFAIEITKANAGNKICRVGQEYLGGYQVINKDFFQLFNQKSNFINLYQGKNEAETINKLTVSLYEVFCSLGLAPVIRVEDSDDDAVQRIAQKLSELFQTCDEDLKKKLSKKQRPLLILFNRKRDVQSMLYHSWKYLSLIEDIFGIRNNQFTYLDTADAQAQKELFELDFSPGADEILRKNMFRGFHEAGPNIDEGLNQWTAEYEKFGGGSNAGQQVSDLSSNLTSALDKLPQLTEQKKKVDMHVKIASKVLREIKERQIDQLQDIEEEAITSRKLAGKNKQDLLNILAIPTPEEVLTSGSTAPDKHLQFLDKLRILVILILCLKDIDELQRYIQIVEDTHTHPAQVQVLEKVKVMYKKKVDMKSKQGADSGNAGDGQQAATTLGYAYSLGKGIASGLSSMLTDANNFSNILAREIDQTLNHMRIRYTQQGTCFVDTLTGERLPLVSHQDLKQVFAFSIGGGSFYEYETIKVVVEQVDDAAQSKPTPASNKVSVVYGCDYVFQPTEFMDEIFNMSKE